MKPSSSVKVTQVAQAADLMIFQPVALVLGGIEQLTLCTGSMPSMVFTVMRCCFLSDVGSVGAQMNIRERLTSEIVSLPGLICTCLPKTCHWADGLHLYCVIYTVLVNDSRLMCVSQHLLTVRMRRVWKSDGILSQ